MNLILKLLKKAMVGVGVVGVVGISTVALTLGYVLERLWAMRPTKALTTEQLRTELRSVAYHVRPYSDDLIKAV